MFNAVIYGASGACGREIVKQMHASDKWENVFVVTRRMIPFFEEYKDDPKLHFVLSQDIMDLDALKEKIGKKRIDAVISALGSRTGAGKEIFTLVDKTYVLQSLDYAKILDAKYFSHISAIGTNSKSCFLYARVKGECEDELKKRDFTNIMFSKPGLLIERDNDYRTVETVFSWVPFLSKITAAQVATAHIRDAEIILSKKSEEGCRVLTNKDLLELAK